MIYRVSKSSERINRQIINQLKLSLTIMMTILYIFLGIILIGIAIFLLKVVAHIFAAAIGVSLMTGMVCGVFFHTLLSLWLLSQPCDWQSLISMSVRHLLLSDFLLLPMHYSGVH